VTVSSWRIWLARVACLMPSWRAALWRLACPGRARSLLIRCSAFGRVKAFQTAGGNVPRLARGWARPLTPCRTGIPAVRAAAARVSAGIPVSAAMSLRLRRCAWYCSRSQRGSMLRFGLCAGSRNPVLARTLRCPRAEGGPAAGVLREFLLPGGQALADQATALQPDAHEQERDGEGVGQVLQVAFPAGGSRPGSGRWPGPPDRRRSRSRSPSPGPRTAHRARPAPPPLRDQRAGQRA
jgi:hypothetical protein